LKESEAGHLARARTSLAMSKEQFRQVSSPMRPGGKVGDSERVSVLVTA
jgi:hypothetical protein